MEVSLRPTNVYWKFHRKWILESVMLASSHVHTTKLCQFNSIMLIYCCWNVNGIDKWRVEKTRTTLVSSHKLNIAKYALNALKYGWKMCENYENI